MATNKAESTVKVLDFTNVKEGGADFNRKRVPAGDYLAKIVKCEDAPSKKDGVHQWLYSFELVEKYTDRTFPYYCKLQENQLWKVRNLFLAAGVVIPKKRVKLDPSRVVGKTIAITLDDDEYEGKLQSNVTATFSASELDSSDDVDDEDTDDDGEETDDEVEDSTEEEDEEEEEEPEPAPAKRRKAKPAPPVEDDDEEEEEEEAPTPPRRKKAAAAKIPAQRKNSPKPAVAEVDDDELESLELEDI